MPDFAESHMKKYGWVEGKGLGKDQSGISEPIKVKIKVDTTGVGHDPGQQFTNHWWEHAFKTASANICVSEDEDGVRVSTKGKSAEVTTKKKSNKQSKRKEEKTSIKSKLYGTFIRSGVLTNGVVRKDADDPSSDDTSDDEVGAKTAISDEQLLRACNGRTAHKGARHGVKQSGKLARLAEQEKIDLETVSNRDSLERKKRKSKKSKNKNKNFDLTQQTAMENQNSPDSGVSLAGDVTPPDGEDEIRSSKLSDSSVTTKIKKKKKKRKHQIEGDQENRTVKSKKSKRS